MANQRPHRRWFAVSLRAMLGAVFVVALVLGSWINDGRQQQLAVAVILAIGSGHVLYDDDPGVWSRFPRSAGLQATNPRARWWPPAFLERHLGRDLCRNVAWVTVDRYPSNLEPSRRAALVSAIRRLHHLVFLSISLEMSDPDVGQLAHLTALQHIELNGPNPELTDAGLRVLSSLTSLEVLRVGQAPVTDAGLASLGNLPQLRTLEIQATTMGLGEAETGITGSGFARFANKSPLESLVINSPTFAEPHWWHLGKFKRLKNLTLVVDRLTDDRLQFLTLLSNLERLYIFASGFNGTGFRNLSDASKLVALTLIDPDLTDAAIPHLARLPLLQQLSIYPSCVTLGGLEPLQATPRLSCLTIYGISPRSEVRLRQILPRCTVMVFDQQKTDPK